MRGTLETKERLLITMHKQQSVVKKEVVMVVETPVMKEMVVEVDPLLAVMKDLLEEEVALAEVEVDKDHPWFPSQLPGCLLCVKYLMKFILP
jgi:hypothetical protein